MPSIFTPPTVEDTPYVNAETPRLAARLFRHYGAIPRGRSVVKVGGTYTTVDTPDQLLLAGLTSGVDFFLGGHEYVVSDAVATALIADGYGANVFTTEWSELTDTVWADISTRTWESI